MLQSNATKSSHLLHCLRDVILFPLFSYFLPVSQPPQSTGRLMVLEVPYMTEPYKCSLLYASRPVSPPLNSLIGSHRVYLVSTNLMCLFFVVMFVNINFL